MRILVLNQYFDPDVAASAQRLTDLAEDLAAHHDVTVIAGRPSYNPALHVGTPRPRPDRLRVRRVLSTAFHRQHSLGRILNYLTYLGGALLLGLTSPKPDVVITATDPPLAGVVGRWVSVLRRVPFIYLLWDVHPQLARAAGLMRPGFAMSAIDALSRHALRHASIVIAPTGNMKESAVSAGAPADRVVVVPLWEDTIRMTPGPRDNAFSRDHGLLQKFVVMYSGNIGLTQRLDLLLDVAEGMRDLEDVVFVLIGEGAGKPALHEEAERRRLTSVRFLPYRSPDEMLLSFAAADVLVVSLAPGLTRYMHPSKVYTIMASGRPVVAALDPASDTARLITRGRFGLVAPPGDAAAVEQHLRWLHDHRDERDAMGRRARAAAEQEYSRIVVVPRYLEIVRNSQ